MKINSKREIKRHRERQRNRFTDIQKGRKTERQNTEIQRDIYRKTNTEDREKEKQINRKHKYRKRDKQKDRETKRYLNKKTDIDTKIEIRKN